MFLVRSVVYEWIHRRWKKKEERERERPRVHAYIYIYHMYVSYKCVCTHTVVHAYEDTLYRGPWLCLSSSSRVEWARRHLFFPRSNNSWGQPFWELTAARSYCSTVALNARLRDRWKLLSNISYLDCLNSRKLCARISVWNLSTSTRDYEMSTLYKLRNTKVL